MEIMDYAPVKHFLVAPLNLPISDLERLWEIITDVKFHSVCDMHRSKSSPVL